MSASNLFFLKCIDKLRNKQFHVALRKKISNEFEKVNLGRPDITYQKWIKTVVKIYLSKFISSEFVNSERTSKC